MEVNEVLTGVLKCGLVQSLEAFEFGHLVVIKPATLHENSIAMGFRKNVRHD